jgi:NO-binding membrane sensor protein with MHYT domain
LEIRYRYDYTLISLVVVIFLCYVGLLIGSHDRAFTKDKSDAVDKFIKDARALSIAEIRKIKNVRTVLLSNLLNGVEKLILAGVIAASGVCVMHYLGMEAMVFDGKITWNGGVIAASVIIAIVAASAAFWILFRLLSFFPRLEMLRVAASVVAALAVNGMHYCGQAAATFNYIEGNSSKTPTSSSAAQWQATIGAIVASAVLLFAILIVAMADLRVWYYNTSAIIRELDIRATLAAGDSHTGAENFLSAYTQLRSTDGSAKAIMEFRVKLKSSSGGSTSQNQTSTASVLPTDTGDEAALVDANLDKMVSPA